MAKIFISYSRKDETFARRLAGSLSELGADIWIDVEDIPAGMKWSTAIQQGLMSADVMLVIISPESMASTNVEDEWQYYLDNKKPVIPLLLRLTKIHFQLSRVQYVDFLEQDYETAFKRLRSELRKKGISLRPTVAGLDTATLPPRPQPPLPVRRKSQRQWWISMVLLLALVIIGAAGFLFLNGGDNERGNTTPTQIAQVTASPSETPEPSLTPSVTPRETSTDNPTEEPSWTPTATPTPTDEPSPTVTETPSETPTDETTPISPADAAASLIAEWATQTATQWTATPTPTLTPTLDIPQTIEALAAFYSTGTAIANSPPVTSNAEWETLYPDGLVQEFDGVDMVLVPAGCFDMGSGGGDSDEKPVHEQCFDDPFWIDKTEVTNAEYARFIEAGGYDNPDYWTGAGWEWRQSDDANALPRYWTDSTYNAPQQPVVGVSWYAAMAYASWRGCRLPTEREWEYAARGPDRPTYPWGDDFVANNVVYSGNDEGKPAEVGSRPGGASWVGAMDMSGNVWEWTSSLYVAYPYKADDGREDIDNTNILVIRGGAFFNLSVRSAFRVSGIPVLVNDDIGFRCADSY